jgi:sugar lactone lactonase YvrE
MLRNNWMNGWTRRTGGLMTFAALLLVASPAIFAASSSVPSAVVTTLNTVSATGLAGDESNVVLDSCGNIYAIQQYGGEVDEIPAGGGAATKVLAAGGANYDPAPLAIDAARANLYVLQGTTGSMYKIPITNCVPQPASMVTYSNVIGNLGAISYYWNGSAVATDAAGDVFIATNVACCAPVNELLVEYGSTGFTTGATLLGGGTSLAKPITSIAVDASDNIYYVAGGTLYELPVTTPATTSSPAVYSATPVTYGSGYTTVVGVSLDSAGNLFVADGGSSTIFEIPYETGGSTSALNPNDQYIVATGSALTLADAVTPAPSGNLFFGNNTSSVFEVTRDNASFGSQAVSSTGTTTLNVVFNAAVTPSSIAVVPPGEDFLSTAGGTCAANTAYTAGSTCTVTASFSPQAPGLARGALVLADSAGTLATANLFGVGLGAGVTIDPGTATAIGTGITAPKGVDLDAVGNLFVADSGSGTIWEIPAGSVTPIGIATGFNNPTGVAADGASDVFVADTKNNQIVEIPVVGGVLSSAGQFTLIPSSVSLAGASLNGPTGLTIDAQGNLYIADTGNNRVVFVPKSGGWNLSQATTLGTGFSGPLATAVTASGLIYVADSGNGKIYSIPYPGAGAPITLVATGFSSPSALRTDAAGDLYVVDEGDTKVVRIPNVGGTLAAGSSGEVSFGIANPFGLAIAPGGNVYVSNLNDAKAPVYLVNRTTPTLSFGNINPQTSSNPASVQVESAGNQALTLSSPFYISTGSTTAFAVGTSEANACANSASLAVGTNCTVEATFNPPGSGTYNETLALESNASGTPQINLTGVGVATQATTTTLTVTSPTGSPYYGQPITLSASVTSSAGTPTGTVALMVDGVQAESSTLSGGNVTFSLKNGLTGGSHTFQAVYSGATTTTVIYASSESAVDTVIVTSVPTTTTVSFTSVNVNPPSQPAGTALLLTATVASTFAGVPSGTVTFNITDSGGQAIAPQTVPLVAASGGVFQATYSFTPPAPASGVAYNVVSFSATYNGDNNFSGSTSGSASFDVGPATGAVLVTASGTTLTSSGPGGSGDSQITFTNTSYGGWNGAIGYQCVASTLPANSICVFSPGQVTLSASTSTNSYPPATTTLQVVVDNPPDSPLQSSILWWMGGLTGALLLFVRRRAMHGAWARVTMLAGLALLAVSASGLMACSNGAQFGTPSGTSTVTVYADSDPFAVANGVVNQGQTQPCGGTVAGSNPPQGDPTQLPCQRATFQISLTVK